MIPFAEARAVPLYNSAMHQPSRHILALTVGKDKATVVASGRRHVNSFQIKDVHSRTGLPVAIILSARVS